MLGLRYCSWSSPLFGLANNHPWILTTLGCPGTPDPRNSCREIPELRNRIPRSRALWAEPRGMVNLRGQGVLRNLSTEEFLGSGVFGHPRVVRIQGWLLAGPTCADLARLVLGLRFFLYRTTKPSHTQNPPKQGRTTKFHSLAPPLP